MALRDPPAQAFISPTISTCFPGRLRKIRNHSRTLGTWMCRTIHQYCNLRNLLCLLWHSALNSHLYQAAGICKVEAICDKGRVCHSLIGVPMQLWTAITLGQGTLLKRLSHGYDKTKCGPGIFLNQSHGPPPTWKLFAWSLNFIEQESAYCRNFEALEPVPYLLGLPTCKSPIVFDRRNHSRTQGERHRQSTYRHTGIALWSSSFWNGASGVVLQEGITVGLKLHSFTLMVHILQSLNKLKGRKGCKRFLGAAGRSGRYSSYSGLSEISVQRTGGTCWSRPKERRRNCR